MQSVVAMLRSGAYAQPATMQSVVAMLRSGAYAQPATMQSVVAMLRSGAIDVGLETTHSQSLGAHCPHDPRHGCAESSRGHCLAPIAAAASGGADSWTVVGSDLGTRLRADQPAHQSCARRQGQGRH